MLKILKFLPRVFISRLVGKLARVSGPSFLVRPVMNWFATKYKINLDEAEKSFAEYQNLNAFFTRRLKPGLRPLADTYFIHPADSRMTQFGLIENNTLIQAKGLEYKLSDFIGNEEKAKKYEGGVFIVYYLCPTDYHRVHSPVEGTVKEIKRLGLDLWPVNEASVATIPELFIVNERAVVSLNSQLGPVEVVFVGATNVGSIEILKKETELVQKGEELGIFHMGSTVVMIYPKTAKIDLKGLTSIHVKIGEALQQAKNPWDN
jgi:phosphatidylserine decarboxylase